MSKLMNREKGTSGNYAFNRNNAKDKFRNFKLQSELDTHDPTAQHLKLLFLKKVRKGVVDMAACPGAATRRWRRRSYRLYPLCFPSPRTHRAPCTLPQHSTATASSSGGSNEAVEVAFVQTVSPSASLPLARTELHAPSARE
jgi:hypothetical protein